MFPLWARWSGRIFIRISPCLNGASFGPMISLGDLPTSGDVNLRPSYRTMRKRVQFNFQPEERNRTILGAYHPFDCDQQDLSQRKLDIRRSWKASLKCSGASHRRSKSGGTPPHSKTQARILRA